MWNANTKPIVKTVEAFSGEAYGRVWNSQGHVIGPQVRVRMSAEDAGEFFRSRRARHFTSEDGLQEGWWSAFQTGSGFDSFGRFYAYVDVVPAAPPIDVRYDD